MGIKHEFITAGAGATKLRDSLLISCPGQGGLVFLGNGDGSILTPQPATGIHWSDSALLSACQDDRGVVLVADASAYFRRGHFGVLSGEVHAEMASHRDGPAFLR